MADILVYEKHVGRPVSRVDGPAKVTGTALYAGEHASPGLLHGVVVAGRITKGRIVRMDTARAEAYPGVLKVFTHENAPKEASRDKNYQDQVGPPGTPFRPLAGDQVLYSGQPIALVVADSFEAARDAAALIRADYAPDEHITELEAVRGQSYEPRTKRSGIAPPPSPRGNAGAAYEASPIKLSQDYSVAIEHHNPMEPFATTVVRAADGSFTVYDKTQGAQNVQEYLVNVFGLAKDKVRVRNPYVGGAFGAGLRPQYQVYLAMMAATALERSVRVSLTRDEMFTFIYRPYTLQSLWLGAERDGTLKAIRHHAIQGTSHFEDHQEVVVNWSGLLYRCENVELTYQLAKLDTYTPGDMRAPGAVLGVYALESAMDELSYELGMDPIALRLKNYAERDENQDKEITSKGLRECFRQGAERFGWAGRSPQPRSMREGRELIGWGMASGVWEAMMMNAAVKLRLTAEGKCEVLSAFADIGTGTYTIVAQMAADMLGLPVENINVSLGDSSLPTAPVEGGSWTAASLCTAVQNAAETLKATLLAQAKKMPGSPLKGAKAGDVVLAGGRLARQDDPASGHALSDLVGRSGGAAIEAEGEAVPGLIAQAKTLLAQRKYVSYTHSAIFAEVRVDEELGVIRVPRIVNAVAAGKIMNPKTARSQIMGGVVMALGSALEEESLLDHRLGRFMNHNFAEYHVPVNADIGDIDVIFVAEHDDKASPIGVKGLGEIGIVGTGAAIANAVFHATGKRIRDLPITIDKLI